MLNWNHLYTHQAHSTMKVRLSYIKKKNKLLATKKSMKKSILRKKKVIKNSLMTNTKTKKLSIMNHIQTSYTIPYLQIDHINK